MPLLTTLTPLFPFLGFLLLATSALFTRRTPREGPVALIGIGSVALSAIACALLCTLFFTHDTGPVQITLWQWIDAGTLAVKFGFHVDALTAVMLAVITGVGLLIHLYAAGYMHGDDSYRRFFAYLNLFICAMTVLVLADNLLLLYLGWEAVGLCSFLLIGFWYRNRNNGRAAAKAFLITRIGDTAFLLGILALLWQFNTLQIQPLMDEVRSPAADPSLLSTCALLLLAGAAGKSAQVPLQTWLPDAMAGPTPVSALIHAATMVTAGVYLIARCHDLFLRSEIAMLTVASMGAITLLIAGCSALVQTDIKRVLAYSTISQLGYMFVALGAGAFSAAIFHLVTHAFFKALLFLAAGVVILHSHHRQSLDAMGGLYRSLPQLCIAFAIGCASLAALPLTAGYFSKEEIIAALWHSGPRWVWWSAMAGAVITGMYSFRLFYRIFFGPAPAANATPVHTDERPVPGSTPWPKWLMSTGIALLSLLALGGGFIHLPLGDFFRAPRHLHTSHWIAIAGTLAPMVGIAIGWWTRHRWQGQARTLVTFVRDGWGFDRVYHWLLARPLTRLAGKNRKDVIRRFYHGITLVSLTGNALLSRSQNGALRWYLTTLLLAAVLALAIVIASPYLPTRSP